MMSLENELETETETAVQEIYRPLLRYYFGIFAAYYLLVLPTHFADYSGTERVTMIAAASLAAGLGIYGLWRLRLPMQLRRVEWLALGMNALVVANVHFALTINFNSAKLVYFVIIAMAFSLASVTFKQAITSIILASISYATFLPFLDRETFTIFAFLALAAAMASLSISHLLRNAVERISDSRLEAERQLSDALQLEQKLRSQSLSDSLTGLPNRRAFFNQLKEAVGGVQDGRDAWLILVDLDGFKGVNDVHGHMTGDMLLKQVAERLKSFGDDRVLVSRMGGDEFNIVWQTQSGEEVVSNECERLLETLSNPYMIDDRSVRISASIGFRPIDSELGTRKLITQADFALMEAKKRGRNQAIMFNAELELQATERFRIEQALRTADLTKELDIVFQPQIHLGSDEIMRAEILVRWLSPEVGRIEPRYFITIAEESGLITGITLIVIKKAFEELSSWPRPIPVSINLSSHDIISDTTIDAVIDLAEEFGITGDLIEFEVTETAMMADLDKAIANLERLTERGFLIALDDFGTGYSNFSHLRALPISKLKVDRSFLENPGDPMTEKILSSLAGMARTLGVHCLLEGVEDEIGLLMARRAGAESIQGYLFGRPMTAQELQDRVSRKVANDTHPDAEVS